MSGAAPGNIVHILNKLVVALDDLLICGAFLLESFSDSLDFALDATHLIKTLAMQAIQSLMLRFQLDDSIAKGLLLGMQLGKWVGRGSGNFHWGGG